MPQPAIILTPEEFDRLPARVAAILADELGRAESPRVVDRETGGDYGRLRDWICGVLAFRREELWKDEP